MEAIILAGGFGTRLRQLVPELPKPMAPVAGRPFLEILLSALACKGFKRVILSTGYMAEKISSHFGEQYAGMELSYVVEEQPLGTGGAVRLALTQCYEEHVFIFNGDTYLDLEVDAIEKLWQIHKRPIIVGREVLDTARYGRLLTATGSVSGFTEKGVAGPGLINAGCYVFCRHQLDSFQPYLAFSLETDYLATEVTHKIFDVFVTEGLFIDIGVPQDFQLAQTMLAGVS